MKLQMIGVTTPHRATLNIQKVMNTATSCIRAIFTRMSTRKPAASVVTPAQLGRTMERMVRSQAARRSCASTYSSM
mgnify:CR=1 FL=1